MCPCCWGLFRLCTGNGSIVPALHPCISLSSVRAQVSGNIKVLILQKNINIASILELSTGEHSLYNGIKIFGIHLFNSIAWLSGSSASVGSLENNS